MEKSKELAAEGEAQKDHIGYPDKHRNSISSPKEISKAKSDGAIRKGKIPHERCSACTAPKALFRQSKGGWKGMFLRFMQWRYLSTVLPMNPSIFGRPLIIRSFNNPI